MSVCVYVCHFVCLEMNGCVYSHVLAFTFISLPHLGTLACVCVWLFLISILVSVRACVCVAVCIDLH